MVEERKDGELGGKNLRLQHSSNKHLVRPVVVLEPKSTLGKFYVLPCHAQSLDESNQQV